MLLWCALLPIALTVSYYAVKKPTDFDQPLNSLRKDVSLQGKSFCAVRLGSRSTSKTDWGTSATSFGINVEDSSFQRAERLGKGELRATYQATYLARTGGSMLPVVITIFKDVTPAGGTQFKTENRGRKPILVYIAYVLLSSAVVVVFLNVTDEFNRRKKRASS